MNAVYFQIIESPIGPLTLVSDGQFLTGTYMSVHRHGPGVGPEWRETNDLQPLNLTTQQLTEYFAGERREFELPLRSVGSEFQKRCWVELEKIPFGETWSYGQMAKRVGNADASRAVGAANGQNPISLIVPCHRVIGASGKLVGFGGGLPRKAALLSFERAMVFGESASEFWQQNRVGE